MFSDCVVGMPGLLGQHLGVWERLRYYSGEAGASAGEACGSEFEAESQEVLFFPGGDSVSWASRDRCRPHQVPSHETCTKCDPLLDCAPTTELATKGVDLSGFPVGTRHSRN